MKPFSERNPFIVGGVGILVVVVVVLAAFNYQRLPFVSSTNTYSALFDDAGGLTTGAPVQVLGSASGLVETLTLEPDGVLVTFTVADHIRLGEQTEAAIKTMTLLGNKTLVVTPRGAGRLAGTIPRERTTSPYQLPDAIGDLSTTISGLNTEQLSSSLTVLNDTLHDTPPALKLAVDGIARFSDSVNKRDEQLRGLLANARKATTILADRTQEIVHLIQDSNAMLSQLRVQSSELDQLSGRISMFTQQLQGLIAEQRHILKPALDKLNGVLTTVDNRRGKIQEALKLLSSYVLSLGEALSSGPFFKAYVANLLPGQFIQPFVDAAFSDLGLDPNVLLPSQRVDPPTGQPGTPALPVPYPRTGQGGDPRLTIPDAITGNPGDQGCGPAGLPLPGPTGCYPYREPPAAPAPGGPPPGPPAPTDDAAPSPAQSAPQSANVPPVEGTHP
ncbi:MCE family protein (plasmid) [Mycolicibacterium psychrotolerans]|uniref:MCE family protein n=1 Tax=Mycolicibacterium psychrotolerans TaxID=216929 RepID=UPI003D664729